MRRVARRMYRRKRRARLIRGMILLLVLAAAAMLWRSPGFRMERLLTDTTPTAVPSDDWNVTSIELHLPAQTWYTIQTGVFSTEEAAKDKADDYAERGAPGTVVASNGKWRVFIAAYGRESEAMAVRQRLGELQRVETYLYLWECPEVRLRLSGPAAQLDAAAAGMTLMQGAAELMRDTSMLLDASQMMLADAMAELNDMDKQLTLWIKTARSAFGGAPPQMINTLLKMAEGCSEMIMNCRAASAEGELSSALKGYGMQIYDNLISMRRELLNE